MHETSTQKLRRMRTPFRKKFGPKFTEYARFNAPQSQILMEIEKKRKLDDWSHLEQMMKGETQIYITGYIKIIGMTLMIVDSWKMKLDSWSEEENWVNVSKKDTRIKGIIIPSTKQIRTIEINDHSPEGQSCIWYPEVRLLLGIQKTQRKAYMQGKLCKL